MAALGAMAACGGGSGGGSAPTQGTLPTTGTVGVLLTDAPTDEFCQVRATIEAIDLLGTNGPTNLFSGPETVNVLDLRNYTDMVAVRPDVPVGTYEKVRLTLSDLALVRCDETTGEPEPEEQWEHPKLPGNGKLDLNPRGSFQVVGGETLIIELDMDMEKSLHAHQTGNGKWQFRPVVFVTIRPDDTKLVRVFGQVRDVDGTRFELCPTEPASSTDDDSNGMNGNMNGDDDSGRCLDVFADGAGIFDENGDPGGTVADGNLLTAIGFLRAWDDDDDADSHVDDLRLDAEVLELGDQGTFLRLQGAVVSTPGSNDIFAFNDGATDLDVLFQSGTRIFALGSNAALGTDALQPGTTGEVDGVFTDPATSGEPLKSSLIVLDMDTTPTVVLEDAKVKTIDPLASGADPALRRFTVDVETASLTGQCVKTDADTDYLLITESASSVTVEQKAGFDAMGLVENDVVDIYGSDDGAGCVVASSIQEYKAATP